MLWSGKKLFSRKKNQFRLVEMFHGEKFQLVHITAFTKGLLHESSTFIKDLHVSVLLNLFRSSMMQVAFVSS